VPEISFHWIAEPNAWAALLTLTFLEIVLGIDNIVFISILVDRLPPEKRKSGRLLGLGLAMFLRLLLLFSIVWIMALNTPIIHVPVHPSLWDMMPGAAEHAGTLGISWKDLILLGGGFFLIWKSTREIHDKLEGENEGAKRRVAVVSFGAVIAQIGMIDIIFSLDSVITAVGMVNDPTRISLMMVAVVFAVLVMMAASGPIGQFVSKYPSIKVLALAFLILIGTSLMAEGLHFHIPKGYIYFAMVFSLGVELVNIKAHTRKRALAMDVAAPDAEH